MAQHFTSLPERHQAQQAATAFSRSVRFETFSVDLGGLTSHITSGRCVGISKFYVGVRIV